MGTKHDGTEMNDMNDEMNGDSFEEMFENSLNRRDDFSIGNRVEGKIVFITGDTIFVDITGKSEAVIEASEFREKDGTLTAKVGDHITAYVVALSAGEVRLTTSIGRGSASPALMEMAYQESIPVHGTVSAAVKGGYSISVGGVRCFCPFSQIDSRQSGDENAMVGRSFLFRIIEYKERGKNIILSRSALVQEQRQVTEESFKNTLKIGDTISGTVSGIRDFGVFVDIGGIEALVPKSELSWSRYADPAVYAAGQSVQAVVKSIDWDTKRLSLSFKDLQPEPWKNIVNYQAGQTITGQVVNIIKGGAFVELEPGLDGFIPVSRMSYVKKINRPEEAVSIGDRISAKILTINNAEKKISLELVTGEADPWEDSGGMTENLHQVIIEAVKPAGLNVRLPNGMLGFMPRGELKVKSETDILKRYSPGQEITAAVLRIEQDSRKLIMSEAQAFKMEERKDYESFKQKEGTSQSTTLGSMLKNKFDDIQKKMDK